MNEPKFKPGDVVFSSKTVTTPKRTIESIEEYWGSQHAWYKTDRGVFSDRELHPTKAEAVAEILRRKRETLVERIKQVERLKKDIANLEKKT